MDPSLLKQADTALTACGARPPIAGDLWLPWPVKSFLVPMTVASGQVAAFPLEITGETPFELRSISSDLGMAVTSGSAQTLGVRLQIQLPSGRYLFGNNGIDVSQFAWIGSFAFAVDPPEECQPGEKIQVTLTDFGGAPLSLNLLFEGCYKYFFSGSVKGNPQSALQIPRYQGILNENILAPCWVAGYGIDTPPGFRDDYYVYSSPTIPDATTGVPQGVTLALPGPSATTIKIPIDQTNEFFCRRILFDLEADSTVTAGIVLGRLRTGDGFSLNDNFIDLAHYLNGVEFPKPWKIRGGDSVFVDLSLADATGTGNMYMQVHLEGYKRQPQ